MTPPPTTVGPHTIVFDPAIDPAEGDWWIFDENGPMYGYATQRKAIAAAKQLIAEEAEAERQEAAEREQEAHEERVNALYREVDNILNEATEDTLRAVLALLRERDPSPLTAID